MIVSFLDLETSGLKAEKGHRIIEICLIVTDADTRREIGRYVQRINPLRSIDPDASKVHGITLDDLKHCPNWESVAPKVAKILHRTHLLVAHNLDGFDGPFLHHELTRVGEPFPATLDGFDTTQARWATAEGKVPKLGELCWALGIAYDPDKAHGAEYDTQCLRDAYFKALDLGFFKHVQ